MSYQYILLKTNIKIRLYIFILIFYLQINSTFCGKCQKVENLLNRTCYNDIIKFDHDKWRSGKGCVNKKGDLIIEFSLNPGESESRLFYGLKKNGRYYFPGEPVYKQIDSISCSTCDNKYKGRFESKNLFVSLKDDIYKNKQYLFSMSSYKSATALFDLENENITYYAWNTINFFGFDKQIFSYEYSLFEIEDTNTYIAVVVESAGYENNDPNKEYAETYSLRKFQFKAFDPEITNTY